MVNTSQLQSLQRSQLETMLANVSLWTQRMWQILQVAHVPAEEKRFLQKNAEYTLRKSQEHMQKVATTVSNSRWGNVSKVYVQLHMAIHNASSTEGAITQVQTRFKKAVQAAKEKYFVFSGSNKPLEDIKNSVDLLELLVMFDLRVREIRLSTKRRFQELLQKVQEGLNSEVKGHKLGITEKQTELSRLTALLPRIQCRERWLQPLFDDYESLKHHLNRSQQVTIEVNRKATDLTDRLTALVEANHLIVSDELTDAAKRHEETTDTFNTMINRLIAEQNIVKEALKPLLAIESKPHENERQATIASGQIGRYQRNKTELKTQLARLQRASEFGCDEPGSDSDKVYSLIDSSAFLTMLRMSLLSLIQRLQILPWEYNARQGNISLNPPTNVAIEKMPAMVVFRFRGGSISTLSPYNKELSTLTQEFVTQTYNSMLQVGFSDLQTSEGKEILDEKLAKKYFGLKDKTPVSEYAYGLIKIWKINWLTVIPIRVDEVYIDRTDPVIVTKTKYHKCKGFPKKLSCDATVRKDKGKYCPECANRRGWSKAMAWDGDDLIKLRCAKCNAQNFTGPYHDSMDPGVTAKICENCHRNERLLPEWKIKIKKVGQELPSQWCAKCSAPNYRGPYHDSMDPGVTAKICSTCHQQEETAATKIQAAFRGYSARSMLQRKEAAFEAGRLRSHSNASSSGRDSGYGYGSETEDAAQESYAEHVRRYVEQMPSPAPMPNPTVANSRAEADSLDSSASLCRDYQRLLWNLSDRTSTLVKQLQRKITDVLRSSPPGSSALVQNLDNVKTYLEPWTECEKEMQHAENSHSLSSILNSLCILKERLNNISRELGSARKNPMLDKLRGKTQTGTQVHISNYINKGIEPLVEHLKMRVPSTTPGHMPPPARSPGAPEVR